MAPSMAIVKAAGSNMTVLSKLMAGSTTGGSPGGMPPKALPIVATSLNWKMDCSTVAATIASSGPGTRFKPGTFGP